MWIYGDARGRILDVRGRKCTYIDVCGRIWTFVESLLRFLILYYLRIYVFYYVRIYVIRYVRTYVRTLLRLLRRTYVRTYPYVVSRIYVRT